MNDWVETILNIEIFAFIALLIWLYLKPIDKAARRADQERQS
ncbi:MAG: hypothetical protein AAF556_06655 [Pseudomonadota bacterium]